MALTILKNYSLVICREHEYFVLLCLRLLSTHLSLAMAGGIVGSVLGNQARPLRNLLFRLVDTAMPQTVENVNLYYAYYSLLFKFRSCPKHAFHRY